MDLSEGSLGWHRTRKRIDDHLSAIEASKPYDKWHEGYLFGQLVALMSMRTLLNTQEESHSAEVTRMEMFG